jgi:hypothetical protein
MTSAARTWWAQKKCARVVRRAWCAAVSVGQRRQPSQQMLVSLSCNPRSTCGKEFFSARGTRLVPRPVSPTRRQRCATSGAQARLVALWGGCGVRVSRCVRRSATCRAASVGSAVARLGGKAARSWARVNGGTGKRPRPSSGRRAATRGPVLRARHPATGGPWHRARRVGPHVSSASGLGSSTRNSRRSAPAAWRQISWVASAQSRPRKAANASGTCGCLWDLPTYGTGVSRDRPAGVLRRHEREPGARQTLRVRCRPPAPLRRRRSVRKRHVLRRAYASSAEACACCP